MSPLAGRRVVVTRARAQAAGLCALLAEHGAQPVLFPAIEIAPLADLSALDRAAEALDRTDWVVFTSANGVAVFWERCGAGRLAQLPDLKFAAIGPATARALEQRGARASLIPDEYVAESLAAALGDVRGQRLLLPGAELARDVLAAELRRRGAEVHELPVYRTLPAQPDATGLAELRRGVDAVTFASSSAVRNCLALLQAAGLPDLGGAVVACIGPITAETARAAGLTVRVQAQTYTTAGLVVALADHFAGKKLLLEDNAWTSKPSP